MERENYLQSLRRMTICSSPAKEGSISPSTTIIDDIHTTQSSQTNPGIWLDTKDVSKIKNKRKNCVKTCDVRSIKGTLYVDGKNLISDGSGGYLLPVDLNDIIPASKRSKPYPSSRYPSSNHDYPYQTSRTYYSNQLPNPNQIELSNPYQIDRRNDNDFRVNSRHQGQHRHGRFYDD